MTFDNDTTLRALSGPQATLIVKQGPQIGIQFSITTPSVIIGREETCDIIIQDAEVSRRHSQISWEGNAFVIRDMGSTNGTFVNGRQITTTEVLEDGDAIGLGQTTLILESQESGPSSPTDFATPLPPQDFVIPSEVPHRQPARNQTRKWFIGGCGCLVLACLCSVAVPALLHFSGLINLTEIVQGFGF